MARRRRPTRPHAGMQGPWVVVRPRDAAPLRPGPPRPIPRVVVRDLGHVEPPPEPEVDPYGGPDWIDARPLSLFGPDPEVA